MGLFRSPQCVVCGRSVKGLEDARQEGKLWFCSPSHHLSYRGPTGKVKQHRGPLRRALRWTLIAFGVLIALIVVLAVVGAFIGTATNSKAAKSARKTVASGPGSRAHPIPLRRSAAVGGGWKLRIISVTWNADRLAKGPASLPPRHVPVGAQDVMLLVTATFIGGGHAFANDLADRIYVIGKHNAPYQLTSGNGCGPGEVYLPPPDLEYTIGRDGQVFSGRTLRGHICFEVAKNDVSSLRLYVKRPLPANAALSGQQPSLVWFALR